MTREEALEGLKFISECGELELYENEKEAVAVAVKSLEAWEDLLQYLNKVDSKVNPRTQGWIDCIRQIYREHMGDNL